ncbi:hypothetical protein Hdeb2414_s0027g00686781 [Helianthus debilis subsp. tardiflorus]
MLRRFRTLFNLRSAIRGNNSKGQYDLSVKIVHESEVNCPPFSFSYIEMWS